MFGDFFYHGTTKKMINVFGSLFNSIYIVRRGPSAPSTSTVRVPIAFGPQRKYMARIEETLKTEGPIDKRSIAITLPRMSYEIVGMNYSPERQLPKTTYVNLGGAEPGSRTKLYTKTPYEIQFQLSIYGKTHEDCLQVVEQVLPYFSPTYTLSVRLLDDYPLVVDDVPLTLQAVAFSDDYEGDMGESRTIIYTLDFEMKVAMYGPARQAKIIEKADIDVFIGDDSDVPEWTRYERISVSTDPSPVSPDSAYVFTVDNTIFGDGDSA